MKKRIIITGACLLGIVGAVIVFSHAVGRKPFQDLTSSDIVTVSVRLLPPDKTVQIDDIDELTGLLNKVVIYDKDNSYTEYDGQAVIFTISMSNGSQKEVMAYNPFLVIDGTGYRTKYKPCEALNRYANELLNGK